MKTAKTYENWERIGEPYEKAGKLYTRVKEKCPRCGGLGIIASRVENDRIIPIPVDNGICYQCRGKKYLLKEVRLYTDKEYEQMEKAKVKAANKRENEREAKMKAEFEVKRAQYLEKMGFNKDEVTYIYFPSDSYNVKEDLKKAGFRFDSILMWHTPSAPEEYKDKVVPVKLSDVIEISAWGEGHYMMESKNKVAGILKAARPQVISSWFKKPKDKFENLRVILTDIHTFSGVYGATSVVRFETMNHEILKWYTTTSVNYTPNMEVYLKGTVKEHINDKYENDAPVTLVTRCHISSIEGE